jgi:hypothetical protein
MQRVQPRGRAAGSVFGLSSGAPAQAHDEVLVVSSSQLLCTLGPLNNSVLFCWVLFLGLIVCLPAAAAAAAAAGCPNCAVHCACRHAVRAVCQLPATVEAV